MVIKRKKSAAMKLLEDITGGPLSLGKFLQSIRLGEDLSQVEFAGQLGISKSHLCDIEKGRKLVSPERAAIFAKVLKYSSEQFVRLALQDQVEKAGLKFKVKIDAA